MIDKNLLQVLQHSIGADQYGHGGGNRNFFGVNPGCRDYDLCIELVELGFMANNGTKPAIFGNEVFFSVTPEGVDVVALESDSPPEPVKRTASQRRYEEWYMSEVDCSYAEWIGVDPEKARVKRLKVHYGRFCGERWTDDKSLVTCKRCLRRISQEVAP